MKRLATTASGNALAPPPTDKLICHHAANRGQQQQQQQLATNNQLGDENNGGSDGDGSTSGNKRFLWSFVPLDVVTSYLNERQRAINPSGQSVATTAGQSADRVRRPLPSPLSTATSSLALTDLNKLTLDSTIGSSLEQKQHRPGLLLCREQTIGQNETNWRHRKRKSPCAILLLAAASGTNSEEHSARDSGKFVEDSGQEAKVAWSHFVTQLLGSIELY